MALFAIVDVFPYPLLRVWPPVRLKGLSEGVGFAWVLRPHRIVDVEHDLSFQR